MSREKPVLVWFRGDLRVADNPALLAAAATGRPVVPVFAWDPATAGAWAPGGAARWWLHGSLERLGERLAALGSPLVLRRGPAPAALAALARETGADAAFWNRRHEPWALAEEEETRAALAAEGVEGAAAPGGGAEGGLLRAPDAVATKAGGAYRVFGRYHRAHAEAPMPEPLPAPAALRPPAGAARVAARAAASDHLGSWGLRPSAPDWAGGLRAAWTPGEAGAEARLEGFLARALPGYREGRDRPGEDGTSRLSPHLAFGEVSARRVRRAALDHAARHAGEAGAESGAETLLRELAWRDFAAHLLRHAPDLPDRPMDPRFARMAWRDEPEGSAAWRAGRTGFPIVDAGMRQLWATGWMHNRVRMVAASFLVKDLLVDWRRGEEWFWDTLVDADLASNAMNWQWVAGCGADAAPFFRVFNPVLQGERFDPDGAYVRAWVPELAGLPDRWIHRPWEAPEAVLRAAGVVPGRTYPRPVVDHAAARLRALDAFRALRNAPEAAREAETEETA
jgi:deoxyribodipyrimidine photo-lyase